MDFYEIIKSAVENNASDIHISTGNKPAVRIDGKIRFVGEQAVTDDMVKEFIISYIGENIYKKYLDKLDVDCSAEVAGLARFRVNIFKQTCGTSVAMRIVKDEIPEITTLNLPQSIGNILQMKEGLVLVTGPTGSGKSTTLAAIINEFNKNKELHIITIEDPIEYVHTPKNSVIVQREVGQHSFSYANALRSALREDPDIILVGEMRDLESISIALTAAETGHLVLSTLHTIGAAKTINRLVDAFPKEQQQQIRIQLSMVLRSVISQRLLPLKSGVGRIGAFEMMFVNNAIGNLIREGKVANINQIIETSGKEGMILLDKYIAELLKANVITPEVASEFSQESMTYKNNPIYKI